MRRLRDVFVSYSGNLYLVFELLDCDLKSVLDKVRGRGLDLPVVRHLLAQMLRGTHACHVRRILHRDLKPQNILLRTGDAPLSAAAAPPAPGSKAALPAPSATAASPPTGAAGGAAPAPQGPPTTAWSLKIADFGLARCYGLPLRRYTHEVVTLWYRAPELLLGSQIYNTPVDLWSIGCIFAEMVTGRALFAGDSEIGQLMAIFRVLGTPSNDVWPGVEALRDFNRSVPNWPPKPLHRVFHALPPQGLDLLHRLLTYDPRQRITAREALRHPFLLDSVPSSLDLPEFPAPAPGLVAPEYLPLDSSEGAAAAAAAAPSALPPSAVSARAPDAPSELLAHAGTRREREEALDDAAGAHSDHGILVDSSGERDEDTTNDASAPTSASLVPAPLAPGGSAADSSSSSSSSSSAQRSTTESIAAAARGGKRRR